ncbi:hypothetical protein KASHIRA_00360 [Serratia phage vB_SmaM-Kashira]|nr:hypothetical protein [Acinetobacter phage ABPH49]URC22630.1 hypothetical protein KASHIRA_00360 [Serratia phage vB_SmaM-Kashira]
MAKKTYSVTGKAAGGGCLALTLFMITMFAAWVTHIVTCFKTDAWGFLIAGAIAAPIGVIHGIGIWFGVW